MSAGQRVVELVGPEGYEHGWIKVGGAPELPAARPAGVRAWSTTPAPKLRAYLAKRISPQDRADITAALDRKTKRSVPKTAAEKFPLKSEVSLHHVPTDGLYHRVEARTPDGKKAGSLEWSKANGDIHMVEVNKALRGKGVASAMLGHAQGLKGVTKPKHSANRTAAGKAWSGAVGGAGSSRYAMKVTLAGDGAAVDLTAETPAASTVHHPYGSPSGPGLFRVKNLQLPAYVQNVAHALQRSGSAKTESQAIGMAVGIVKRWAAGVGAKGKKVHPDVQAAAARAVAEWEAAKATAHSHANEAGDAVDLSATSPHQPAGSPNGGQFGTNSGGDAGKTPAQQHALHQAHMAHLQRLVATGKATPAQRAELARLTPKAAPKTAAKAPKVAKVKKPAVKKPKVKATPGHPVVNKKNGTVTAVVNGKQVTMRLHEWHVIHQAHQQAVARQQAMKAGAKFAGDGGDVAVIELVGPGGWSHGWIKVGSPAHSELGKMSPAGSKDVKESLDQAHSYAERQPMVAVVHLDNALSQAKADPGSTKNLEKAITAARDKVAAQPGGTYTKEDQQRNSDSAYWRGRSNLAGNRLNYANDDDPSGARRFLDLAFAEALAERVPPGRPEGGRFVPAEPALGRYDTPDQTARAVNAMERPQRAAVRSTTLPPPGMSWTDMDRLAIAVTG